MLDFRNTNTLWASVLVETLNRLGLTIAVISPGSRSAPLTIAFAAHPHIETVPVLDERSAAFFALGIAKRLGRPTVLVCTSGTAAANFYPAVIEAQESGVPLLLLTADRPAELRHCNAGQTIDQQKLYGSFVNWYAELAMPIASLPQLAYLRQTLNHAWNCTLYPRVGPVHLNVPLRDPLVPVPEDATTTAQLHQLAQTLVPDLFFASIQGTRPLTFSDKPILPELTLWAQEPQGIIIAGVDQPPDPQRYSAAIARLSKMLGWPVLAEGLSPVRNYAQGQPFLISTYDMILRQASCWQDLRPNQVIRLGAMPTSRSLRQWLAYAQPRQWILDAGDRNLDPLHLASTHLRVAIDHLLLPDALPGSPSTYLQQWLHHEQKTRNNLDRLLQQTESLFEGKVAWLLAQHLPPQSPLFIANSTPVRDVEWFWPPNVREICPFFNRGANGIDGTLSTALGIAHHHQPTVLLTGDLALLHDTNGFLVGQKLAGHLTIVLINNNGGGIFELLPIRQFDPFFETFFATPQNINYRQLCQVYGVEHHLIQSWEHLTSLLNPLPAKGLRVLEVPTDRRADAQWRQQHLWDILA